MPRIWSGQQQPKCRTPTQQRQGQIPPPINNSSTIILDVKENNTNMSTLDNIPFPESRNGIAKSPKKNNLAEAQDKDLKKENMNIFKNLKVDTD